MIRALLALLWLTGPVAAETLVAELSNAEVLIASDFHGSEIALFGYIEAGADTRLSEEGYQVLATVSGPLEDVLVQRKVRRMGIWVNGEGHTFVEMPSYYAIYGSESARPLLEPGGSAEGLSLERLGFLGTQREPFREALEQARAARGQFRETIGAVDFITERFFRAIIRLPAVAETGVYTVTVHLFHEGRRLDTLILVFTLERSGYGARIWAVSREAPLLYGLATVALALLTGYVGGVVFRRS